MASGLLGLARDVTESEVRTVGMIMGWFAKVEALGNDFVWLLAPASSAARRAMPARAPLVCDRHRGVGADGVVLWNGRDDEPRVWFFNADGSRAEVCGNGLRAVAVAGHALGLFAPGLLHFTSEGCTFPVRLEPQGRLAAAGLGIPRVVESPTVCERLASGGWRGSFILMPNPHIVVFDGPASQRDRTRAARFLASAVPHGANVGFARIPSEPKALDLCVWERGVGWTLACGTGAAAAVVAAQKLGLVGTSALTVRQSGGDLHVWVDSDGRPWIQGGASLVYVGHLGALPPCEGPWRGSSGGGRGAVKGQPRNSGSVVA